MHPHTPRARTHGTTMAQRSMNPRPQKEENRRFFAHYRKRSSALTFSLSPRSHRSSHSPHSPSDRRARACRKQQTSPTTREPSPPTMPITISIALCRWLLEKRMDGYIKVVEAPPHHEALENAKKLNIDTVTNATIRKKLDLSSSGEKHFDIPPAEDLQKYFGAYSMSAKAYRTKDIPDTFFREIAKF